EEQRQRLIKFFNPLNSGTVKVNYCGIERYINYEVESFKDNRTNLYEQLNFTVYIICPDPYFYEAERLEELTTWIGGLNFPLNLPFNLKQRGEDKKNIFNDGHVDTPVEVVFKGPAINPKIVNQTTGKFIQVNRELTSEDTLYITTQYRNKKVEIERNGVRTNAFNYIDLDSTFFNLSVGDNLIEYSTQSLEPQGVSIKYSQKYLGV
ncbi:MAG: phage tail family protein, partial [Peptostreptococcaceae bacterium]|nr:phage tail family protein [Peptostreptococcaceae bacterium]